MNTLHLKYAVEIEKTGSITRAAENLFMGQPTLSKNIKELELRLGITIFKRTTKGVIPTKKGAQFLKYAKNILSQVDKIETLRRPEDENKQRFSISVPRASYISQAFLNFTKELDKSGGFEINYKETNSMRAINKVLTGEYNLGIIRYQTIYENYFLDFLKDKNIKLSPIWEFECLALMHKTHPLANEKNLKYEQLREYTELVHGDNVVPYLSAEKTVSPETPLKQIYIYERASQFDLLREIEGAFMWASPVPEKILETHGLVSRRCSFAGGKYKDALICMHDYTLTSSDTLFLQELEKVQKNLAAKKYF